MLFVQWNTGKTSKYKISGASSRTNRLKGSLFANNISSVISCMIYIRKTIEPSKT